MKKSAFVRISTPKSFVLMTMVFLFFSCDEVKTQTKDSGLIIDQEILAKGFEIPWAIAVIGENDFLFTERMGALYRYRNGEVKEVVGLPESRTFTVDRPYAGMMDISLHPNFKSNQMAYLAYVDKNYQLSVGRFRLEGTTAQDFEIIFSSNQFSVSYRFAWPDQQHFFLPLGVGGLPIPDPLPQDLNDPRGKIFRLMAGGSVPGDNPVFPGMSEPTGIWSYGLKDLQGLYYNNDNGILHSNEHGPLGGNEFNVITKGCNYGWPPFSCGLNYDGSSVNAQTTSELTNWFLTMNLMRYWSRRR